MWNNSVLFKASHNLSYLRALQVWDQHFPGFEHENHGVENINGTYFVYCLRV
jgi:arginine decarboxylase